MLDLHPLLRRERDSNPRRCYPQRFSRPPQSTTLPSLRKTGRLVLRTEMLAERTRFELVVGLLLRQFSKLVVSATHPPLLRFAKMALACAKICQKSDFAKYRHVFLRQFFHRLHNIQEINRIRNDSLRLNFGRRRGQLLPSLAESVVGIGDDNERPRVFFLYFHLQFRSFLIAQHHHKNLLFRSRIQACALHIRGRAVKVLQYVLTQHFHLIVADDEDELVVFGAVDGESQNTRSDEDCKQRIKHQVQRRCGHILRAAYAEADDNQAEAHHHAINEKYTAGERYPKIFLHYHRHDVAASCRGLIADHYPAAYPYQHGSEHSSEQQMARQVEHPSEQLRRIETLQRLLRRISQLRQRVHYERSGESRGYCPPA